MKKILFTILLLVAAINVYASQIQINFPDGRFLRYEITSDSTVSVTCVFTQYVSGPAYSSSQMYGDLVIPSSITHNGVTYTVTGIKNYSFRNCTAITSVTIPNTVTSIGGYAFTGCAGLTAVYYTGTIAQWCEISFANATSNPVGCSHSLNINGSPVIELVIPEGVTSIKSYAFYKCSSLTSVTIPNSVTNIGSTAFYQCTGLTSVSIGNSVTSIGGSAFYQCTGLTSVTIPNSVTNIGSTAFYQCTGLTSVSIGNSVTSIGGSAFYQCTGLTSVTIPTSVTSIGNTAFYGCTGLTSFSIPNSVTSIGSNVLYNCSGIESLYIGIGITTIGNNAFRGCTGIRYICYNAANNSTALFGTTSTAPFYNTTMPNFKSLVIGDSVLSIPSNCFSGGQFDSLYLGCGITSIGSDAFTECSEIKFVHYNAANYSGSLFFGTDSPLGSTTTPYLTTVVFGDSIRTIPSECLYNRPSIENIYIGNNVTTIGSYAFEGCTGIRYIYYNAANNTRGLFETNNYSPFYNTLTPNFTTLVIGDSVQTIPPYCFYGRPSIEDLQLGNSVTSIGTYAFAACTGITTLNIPNSVTNIGSRAFESCSEVDSLFLGSGITTIESRAFQGCWKVKYIYYNAANNTSGLFGSSDGYTPFYSTATPNFTTLVIGDSVRGIPTYCFYNRSSIENVQFGDNVTTIGAGAFSGCRGIDSLYLGSSVSTIGVAAFYECTGLTDVFFPNSLTTIGESAFSQCGNITSLNLPSSLMTIGIGAFKNCSGVTTLVIPDSVTSISAETFRECSGIDSLYLGCGITTIGDFAFQGCTGIKYIYYNAANNTTALFSSSSTSPFCNTNVPNFTTLVIGDSVRTIPSYCFYNRSCINNFQMGNGVTSIGSHAFNGCNNITTLTLPNTTTQIGDYAFYNCRRIHAVDIPGSVQTIGDYAFYGCDSLETLTIGEGVLSIGSSAFSGTLIHKLTIPQSVTNIGSSAFHYCRKLDSIFINSTVATIGNVAFSYCDSLKYMYFNLKNPQVLNFTGGSNSSIYQSTNKLETIVTGDSVLIIPNSFFSGKTSIKTIHLGSGIETIGDYAFSGCTGLSRINIPEGLDSIMNGTFRNCERLLNIRIPDNVSYIGPDAFWECKDLDSIYFGSGIVSVSSNVFSGCVGVKYLHYNNNHIPMDFRNGYGILPSYDTLRTLVIGEVIPAIPSRLLYARTGIDSVHIGSNVAAIGDSAFFGCSGIGNITIPNSTTYIGKHAFYGCSGIKNLSIGYSVQTIGIAAFRGCTSIKQLEYNARNCNNALFATNANAPFYSTNTAQLTTLIIGDSVEFLPNYAFYNRSSISSVQIGTNVQTIGSNAFRGCSNIGQLVIPESVTSIGSYAFYGCNKFPRLVIPNGVTSIGDYAFYGCSGIDSLYIGNGITTIGTSVFQGCSGIHGVIIPEGITSIGNNAFYGCSGFDRLIIPDAVTSIGNNAFYGCSGIDSLHIGSGITTIGSGVFQGCSGIHSLVIPNNITSIGINAFYGCTGIMSLSLGNGVESIGNSAFQGCSGFTKLTIPNSVTNIGSNAFYGCASIDSLYIGSGVQTIGSGAFRGCTGLRWLNYNSQNVPTQAFYGCTQLATLILGNTVQNIGDNAFYNCDNLLTADINATQIGANAFANCDRLVTVTLGDNVQTIGTGVFRGDFRLRSCTMGDNVTSIGRAAFIGCERMNAFDFGQGVQTIGDSAFHGCALIHDINMPEGLTSVGNCAFRGCSSLTGTMTFPSTVQQIGNNVFQNGGTIEKLVMYGTTPPVITATTFAGVSTTMPVEVPCGTALSYYTTNYWENFSNLQEALSYRLTVGSNNETMGSATVTQRPTCTDNTAIIHATANPGYHFLEWSDGNGANPRQVFMTQDSAFTAVFVVNNSYISVQANDDLMGTTTGTGTYGYLAAVTLTATPRTGFHFLRWNDGVTDNPRYLQALQDSSFTAIFVSNVINITVVNANSEMGTVGGSGIYYYPSTIAISATPNYGYHFSGWSDGVADNPRNVTLMQDSVFTAHFSVNNYVVNVSSGNASMGSVSGGGSYTYQHEMQLEATAAYGYHFVQWNDGNHQNPRTLTVTRDTNFVAQFAANIYTLTVGGNDALMGSAYGGGSYTYGSNATLTASANYGYHFSQWNDGNTDNPRIVTVGGNAQYTALFEINTYDIAAVSANPAIGTATGGGTYNYQAIVYLSATPAVGYHFTQWSDGVTANPRQVTVTQSETYTAQFAINSYSLQLQSSNPAMGSVGGQGSYTHGATATLTATANYGYHFVQWSDGNTDNPRSVSVTANGSLTALFDFNSYTLTAYSSNITIGSVSGSGDYEYLSQVALTAIPTPHYHFTMWNDSIEDNPRTITVTRDSVFTAHFVIDTHTVTVASANTTMGSASGSTRVAYNTGVWIDATANYGYHFTHWSDGNTSAHRRIIVTEDTSLTALFAPNQYTATFATANSVMGTVSTTGGSYEYLTTLTVTATPNYGYHFEQWNDQNTDNPRMLTLTQDTSLTALFAANIYHVTLSSNDSTMGSVDGDGDYSYLSQVTISATAAPHRHFVQWNDGNTTNPRLVTLTRDTSFMAIFESDQQYQITVTANDNEMGSVEGSGMYYLGETVTITATANEHYYFAQWSDGMTTNPRVITVTGDMTYTAVFEPVMYTLTVEANDYSMGQVTGGGSYAYGTEVTIEARAFGGYRFLGWSDGVMNEQRTVTVTEDASYTALFEPNVGIDDVEAASYKVYVSNGLIVVEGVEDKRVQIFDITGRPVYTNTITQSRNHTIPLPTGVYMVRIDNRFTKKVVVL